MTYYRMGIIPTCSCTPYLFGNSPHFGEHIAWAESSAVCYANSVLGAHTNREGGPSALASALTGKTPNYGLHLTENRRPDLTIRVKATLKGTCDFGALGIILGRAIEQGKSKVIPYIRGIPEASLEELKSFCASLATYGGSALFYMEGVTPECAIDPPADDALVINRNNLDAGIHSVNKLSDIEETDFVSLGCPHLSLQEIARVADRIRGKKVRKTFWLTTARPIKFLADQMGYTAIIEKAGAVLVSDTCCVVAPIQGRFKAIATDSAKACYYASTKNGFATHLLPFDEVIEEALK